MYVRSESFRLNQDKTSKNLQAWEFKLKLKSLEFLETEHNFFFVKVEDMFHLSYSDNVYIMLHYFNSRSRIFV